MRRFCFFFFLFFHISVEPVEASGPVAASRLELTALSYNIKGLPSFAANGYDEDRFADIGDLLAKAQAAGTAPEIVALQESFVARTTELRARAGYSYIAKGPEAASLLGVDSGLYILSRYPIVKEAHRAFGDKLCASWDCYSNKGVQFARVQIPGAPFPLDVYNTHMQASRELDSVRREQVKIVLDFINETHAPGAPILFLGDFNFRPGAGDQSFKDFVMGSSLVHAGKLCLDSACAPAGQSPARLYSQTVDHQFISTDTTNAYRILPLRAERNFAEPVKGRALSDHLGLEIRYALEWGVKEAAPVRGLASGKKKK